MSNESDSVGVGESATIREGKHFQTASDLITNKLGLEKIEGFSLSNFFSEVFRRHPPAEVENLFTVGSELTTPALHTSMGVMPNPWIFSGSWSELSLLTACFS
jgi:hypothetical protein